VDGEPIAAVATPPGHGAIAVVRVSGQGIAPLLGLLTGRATFTPRRATRVSLHLGDHFQDDALATWFPAPHSYTGEDSFELSVHGTPVVTRALLEVLARQGVRLARPGEFTLRAFLHGRMDLVEAEAVGDLVRAVTPAQARVAAAHLRGAIGGRLLDIANGLLGLLERLEASLDFPDEGYHFVDPAGVVTELRAIASQCSALLASGSRGRLLRDGAAVAVVGRPNVGKSSLFNALVGHARAIVTDVPGTTRDVLRETIDLGGVPAVLMDTAGIRETSDAVEQEGVARAEASAFDADIVVVVVDGTECDPDRLAEDAAIWASHSGRRRCVVVNKMDKVPSRTWSAPWVEDAEPVLASALTGEGLEQVRTALVAGVGQEAWEPDTVTNARHLQLLRTALVAVEQGIQAAQDGATEEYVAVDVREALHALEEIRGRVTSQDVLEGIFARFCIGK
jgi:tRNA modification GTPase